MTEARATKVDGFTIRDAVVDDVGTIMDFIRGIAKYEKMENEVVATEEKLKETLFGSKPYAEVVIGEYEGAAVCYGLFFTNYSTFTAAPGLYLEDLYVIPEMRGRGFGKCVLSYLAKLAVARKYCRFEWCVLDWNEPAIKFYESQGATLKNEWRICRATGEDLNNLANKF